MSQGKARRGVKRTARPATQKPSSGGGHIVAKLTASLIPNTLSVPAVVLALRGSVSDSVGTAISLHNTVQTYDGVTDDVCIAVEIEPGRYEIISKPCAPNVLNDPSINMNP